MKIRLPLYDLINALELDVNDVKLDVSYDSDEDGIEITDIRLDENLVDVDGIVVATSGMNITEVPGFYDIMTDASIEKEVEDEIIANLEYDRSNP